MAEVSEEWFESWDRGADDGSVDFDYGPDSYGADVVEWIFGVGEETDAIETDNTIVSTRQK
jgi:hypothetical protein